jgi:hypothetical protein
MDPEETYRLLMAALVELDELRANMWANSEAIAAVALAGQRVYELGSDLSEWLAAGGVRPAQLDSGASRY